MSCYLEFPICYGTLLLSIVFAIVGIITSLGLFQFIFINALVGLTSIVAMEYLGSDFHLGIVGYKVGWNLNAVLNFDTRGSNGLKGEKVASDSTKNEFQKEQVFEYTVCVVRQEKTITSPAEHLHCTVENRT